VKVHAAKGWESTIPIEGILEFVTCRGDRSAGQYAKFCQPFGHYQETQAPEYRFRLGLAELITRHQLDTLRARLLAGRPPA
jgi:hypothetical protein